MSFRFALSVRQIEYVFTYLGELNQSGSVRAVVLLFDIARYHSMSIDPGPNNLGDFFFVCLFTTIFESSAQFLFYTFAYTCWAFVSLKI